MTKRADIERVLDLWLAEGPTRVPDRVFDDAVARVYRQPQPAAWRSRWRPFDMTAPMRLTAAIVAIVAALGVGLVVFRPGPDIGTPTFAPSPSSTQPTLPPLPVSGAVEPGRYRIDNAAFTHVPFTVAVPAGWIAGNGAGLVKHPDDSAREIGWGATIVDNLFADPCGANDLLEIGPTAQDLIEGLRALPGPTVRPPYLTSIDGRSGQIVIVTVEGEVDVEQCDPPIGLQLWQDRNGNYLVAGPGQVSRLYVMDVGERFVLTATYRTTGDPGDTDELNAMIESIQFEP